ncbi:MAG: hypothetical protein FJ255_01745 [Phycisphaerae bacterium]|nr:hypothetical protein [Phycisphaerae bacterium]
MTLERLREAMHAWPFQAFTIVMGGGSRCRATHPGMIAFSPRGPRIVPVAHAPGRHAALDLPLMTAPEFGNEKARRRRVS